MIFSNIYFSKMEGRIPHMSIISQKWYSENCGRVYWGPLDINFETKLSEETIDHQESFLGIILSHVWVFLDQ